MEIGSETDQGTRPCCTFSPAVTSDPDTRVFLGDLSVTSELHVGKHQGWIMSTMPGPEGSHCGPWTALGPVYCPCCLQCYWVQVSGCGRRISPRESWPGTPCSLNGQSTYSVGPYSHQSIQFFAHFYIHTHMLAPCKPTYIRLSFSLLFLSSLLFPSPPSSTHLSEYMCVYIL